MPKPEVQSPANTGTTATSLSQQAARLFTVRATQWEQRVRAGQASREQADARLRPWLALACLACADLPHYAELLAERREVNAGTGTLALTEGELHSLIAMDIMRGCGPEGQSRADLNYREQALAVLTAARDAALDAEPEGADYDSPQSQQARALRDLADHFGCKAYLPGCTPAQRKAA